MALFSPDDKFLATTTDSYPSTVFIWDLRSLELFVVLVMLKPVKSACWAPETNHLAFCTGEKRM